MGRWRLWKHLPDFDNLLRFSLEEMLSNSDFFEEPFDISAHFLAPNFQWQMTHLQKSSIGGNKIRYFALFYSTTMYCACSLHQDYSKKKFLQDNWPAAKDPVPRAKFELEQRTEKPEKLIMSVSFTYSKRTLTFCCCKIRVTNVFGSNWHFWHL